MTCADLAHAEPERVQDYDRCSWQAIAAAVRRQAETLPAEARTELEKFADLLDGIAQLEKAGFER